MTADEKTAFALAAAVVAGWRERGDGLPATDLALTRAIADALAQAVDSERTRCAEVAEDLFPSFSGPGWLAQEGRRDIARQVARAILEEPTT